MIPAFRHWKDSQPYGGGECYGLQATHHHPVTSSLRQQLAVFSALDPENRGMYLHHMEIFLFIAEKGRASYADIEQEFNISNAAASRSLNSISMFARHRNHQLGLIEIMRDPAEGRRYLARLTPKGKNIAKLIWELGEFPFVDPVEPIDSESIMRKAIDSFDETTPV